MDRSDASIPWSGLSVLWRGHFLLFDKKPAPAYDASTGARLLVIAVAIEAFRLVVVKWLPAALPPLILVLLLLASALLLVRFAARLMLSQIGLSAWLEWH